MRDEHIVKVTVEKYRCLRCGHQWFPRAYRRHRKTEDPAICPACKSAYWKTRPKS